MGHSAIDTLLQLMAQLRDPERGCAWDVAQSFETIAPYTIEEAYEVADAIERGDMDDLRDELGDLLLQVVFHARMAEEAGRFAFEDVAAAICAKLIRRHPHVFTADGTLLPPDRPRDDPETIKLAWERIKREERAVKASRQPREEGPLHGVPRNLPALARAEKISRKAAGYGFDWPDAASVIAKVREETGEVEQSLAAGEPEAVAEEIGDLLFAVANLARHAGVDPETALARGTAKFERRFSAMAGRLGPSWSERSLAEMEEAWQAIKRDER